MEKYRHFGNPDHFLIQGAEQLLAQQPVLSVKAVRMEPERRKGFVKQQLAYLPSYFRNYQRRRQNSTTMKCSKHRNTRTSSTLADWLVHT